MNFKKAMLASLLIVSASGAFAADNATLSVKGTIAPSACTVGFNGGGDGELVFDVTDYVGVEKQLAPQTIPFNITCNPNAALVTFKVSDNATGDHGTNQFGLGEHAGINIGRYSIRLMDMTADGDGSRLVRSQNNGSTWEVATSIVNPHNNQPYAFSNMTDLEPTMAKSFSSNILITPIIKGGLPTAEPVELQGSATITITQI